MASRAHSSRLPIATALAGLVLVLYYASVFKPLSRRVDDLDGPLTNLWHSFVTTNRTHEACACLDFTLVDRRV